MLNEQHTLLVCSINRDDLNKEPTLPDITRPVGVDPNSDTDTFLTALLPILATLLSD